MKGLLIATTCLFFVACGGERAISLLEAEGYENVKITNYGRMRCTDNEDIDRTSFTADRYGEEVEGPIFFATMLPKFAEARRCMMMKRLISKQMQNLLRS